MLLLDIDHFKSFNDTYGHTTGDAVLAAFARNIKKFCHQECYPARYGGEEFAVILTGRDTEALAQKAAELRRFVSSQTIAYEDLQLKITASAGLCILSKGDTLQTAYDRADEGLYRAKKAGEIAVSGSTQHIGNRCLKIWKQKRQATSLPMLSR